MDLYLFQDSIMIRLLNKKLKKQIKLHPLYPKFSKVFLKFEDECSSLEISFIILFIAGDYQYDIIKNLIFQRIDNFKIFFNNYIIFDKNPYK